MTQGGARGTLIAVEGGDRGGKSTQCARIVDALRAQGRQAELVKFPDRTTAIGKLIDAYLRRETELPDEAVHLLFSANRWELRARLESMLAAGTCVVLDRYAYSGVAYSAAKGLAPAWCMAADAGLPRPDVVFEIVLPADERTARGGFGDERYEQDALQRRVSECFAAVRAAEIAAGVSWLEIDGVGSIDAVSERVLSAAFSFLSAFDRQLPIARLSWL